MNRLDELTDINFRHICQSKSKSMYSVNFVDENGEQLRGEICNQIAEYMAENRLVRLNGENCHLDLMSEHICEIGWTEHLKSINDLPKNTNLSFDATTMENLERLKNGQTITLTKDSHKESAELIRNLNNLGILHKPTRFGYACNLSNRKYLTKIIELKSWENFLDWSENNNNKSNITNDFSGSTIGQVNQSSSFSNSLQKINNNPKETITQKKKFWELISENKLISGIILIIIGYLIKLIFGIEF